MRFSESPEDRSKLFLALRSAEKKGFYQYDDTSCDAKYKVV